MFDVPSSRAADAVYCNGSSTPPPRPGAGHSPPQTQEFPQMSLSRSPRARRVARKLVLLPILVTALLVVLAPATAAPKWDSWNGGAGNTNSNGWGYGVTDHKPAGNGDGRKFK
jgi:hypothetical protein